MTEPVPSPRALDHLVLPFETLVAARTVFDALGFTVAPDAVHPFGTGNACVFLADGTYLEPLAKVDAAAYETALDAGNLFVASDAAFRARGALPAVSAMAFRSEDALSDREEFSRAGMAEPGLVEFCRTFETVAGERRDMAFRLAFARPDPALDVTAFLCQPLHDVAPDRSSLTHHANRVSRLLRVVFFGADPDALADRLGRVARSAASPRSEGAQYKIVSFHNAYAEVASDAELAQRYRVSRERGSGGIVCLVLGTHDLGATRQALEAGGLAVTSVEDRLVVPLGSGTVFIAFEEVSP